MKRLHVFVLSLLLALGMFTVTSPFALADETDPGSQIVTPGEGDDPEPPAEEPGWHEADGAYYYILEDGTRATGWLELDGAYYWFDEEGIRFDKGWKLIDALYYFFDTEGVMQHDTTATYGDNTYYLNSDGTVATGWIAYDGGSAYAGSNGVLYKSKWLNSDGKWYYFGSDFKMLANDAVWYNGGAYAFDSTGAMYIGWFTFNGVNYYAGSNGRLYRNEYLSYNGKTYYFDANCVPTEVEGSWISYNGNWYFRYANGGYATGWTQIAGKWYNFSSSAVLFRSRWIKSGNDFYYVGSSGFVLTSTTTPDGATVDANGRRISGPTDTKAQGYSSSTGYLILVNYTYHTFSVYTGSRNNWKLNQCFPCSLGKDSTKTPTGTFYTTGRTYSFGDSDHTCYYATGYIGMNYLIHSVLYYPGTMTVKDGRLGMNISGGCIRLYIDDAKWVYFNVPLNTPVVIYY